MPDGDEDVTPVETVTDVAAPEVVGAVVPAETSPAVLADTVVCALVVSVPPVAVVVLTETVPAAPVCVVAGTVAPVLAVTVPAVPAEALTCVELAPPLVVSGCVLAVMAAPALASPEPVAQPQEPAVPEGVEAPMVTDVLTVVLELVVVPVAGMPSARANCPVRSRVRSPAATSTIARAAIRATNRMLGCIDYSSWLVSVPHRWAGLVVVSTQRCALLCARDETTSARRNRVGEDDADRRAVRLLPHGPAGDEHQQARKEQYCGCAARAARPAQAAAGRGGALARDDRHGHVRDREVACDEAEQPRDAGRRCVQATGQELSELLQRAHWLRRRGRHPAHHRRQRLHLESGRDAAVLHGPVKQPGRSARLQLNRPDDRRRRGAGRGDSDARRRCC